MTLKSHWMRKAQLRTPITSELPTSAETDFLFALLRYMGRKHEHAADRYHARVFFNDNTDYHVCKRYEHSIKGVAVAELKRCAMLLVPTDDDPRNPGACEISDYLCIWCATVLREVYDVIGLDDLSSSSPIDHRMAWRNISTGKMVRVVGRNTLGGLP